jgi:hypothetical protein
MKRSLNGRSSSIVLQDYALGTDYVLLRLNVLHVYASLSGLTGFE